jgi:hypothetical protein
MQRVFSATGFSMMDFYLHYINVKICEICKTAENAFEKYVYSNGAYLFTLLCI